MTPPAIEPTRLERLLARVDTALALCLAAVPLLAAWWLLTASRPGEVVPYAIVAGSVLPPRCCSPSPGSGCGARIPGGG